MSKAEQRKQLFEKVKEFKASGQIQAAWCREKNINIRTFNYWNTKFKKESEKENKNIDWISINPNEPVEACTKSDITIKIGGTSVEINKAVNSDFLFQVLKTIKTL